MIECVIAGGLILLILALGAASLREIAKMEDPKDEPVDALWWHEPDEIYTDPCEVCHRWSECRGVDQENCPLWKKGENNERKI